MKQLQTYNLKDKLRESQHLAAMLSVNASSTDRPHYAKAIIFIAEALVQVDGLLDYVEVPEVAHGPGEIPKA